MRKFLALAALVLGLASCQNEPEGLNIVTGGEVDTVVTVTLPEATRASSADSGIKNVDDSVYDLRYILEVYDATNENEEPVFVYRDEVVKSTSVKTVTFPVRLIPERDYKFVVWADFIKVNAEDPYYYNTTSKTSAKGVKYGLDNVTIAYGKWVAMDEARDAYTAVESVKSYNSGKSINLTLIRPFGKLRVITTDIAALDALAVNARPTAVTVTYKNGVYTGFNALTETGLNAGANAVFNNTLSADQYEENDDENMVLFTDYIFGTTTGTIQFDMKVTYANGNTSTNSFNTEIPVQRNYLTTISGNILTDGNDIRVDITDGFENDENPNNPPYYQETISSAAEFYAAVAPGNAGKNKKYIVISALNLTSETISTLAATRAGEANGTTTIDLNGYTITVDNKSDRALITLVAGQTIVFTDSSVTENTPEDEKGKIILTDNSAPLFKANNDAAVVVEGGSVEEDAVDGNFFVNDGDSENAASSLALLKHICENGGEFTFSQDLEGNVMVEQQLGKNIVINGNDYKFNGVFTIDGNGGGTSTPKPTNTLTFKNIKFETAETKDFISVSSTIDGHNNYAYNVIFDGCEFNGINDATVVGMRMKQVYGLTIKDCVTNNVHSLAQLTNCYDILIEDTTINGGTGINFLSSIHGGGANIVNCTINATEADGFGIRADASIEGDIKVKNCNITANTPIWVRRVTTDNCFKLALEGNTLTKGGLYDVVFTAGDNTLVIPTVSYEITGAEGLLVYPEVIVVAEGVHLKDEAYCINNKAGMFWFANEVNANKNSFSGKTVKLDANIDLNNDTWTPISQTGATQFNGTFDGQNYTISNLNINTTDKGGNYASGLFGWILAAKVKNVKIDTANITAQHFVGAIAGYIEYTGCTVENCHVANATIVAEHNTASCGNKVGGIVGFAGNADTKVKDCTVANSSIKADRDAGQVVGAALAANVENCSATNVTVTAADGCSDEDAGKNIRNEVIGRVL